MEAAIGIDVGGTAIKSGLVLRSGEALVESSIDTEAVSGVDHVVGRIIAAVREMEKAAAHHKVKVSAVGLGVPGILSHERGVVIAPPNLTGWHNVPITSLISNATGHRVVLENDANNAAWGEYLCGAGRGARDVVIITIGTGIGGGVILNGKLWRGAGENAGELGHTIVQTGGRRCGCGQLGCLEAYASATNTARRAAELIESGRPSGLKPFLQTEEGLTAKHVIDAAESGDPVAREVWDGTCHYLAVGCLNIHRILCGQRIVLSGGMSAAGEKLRQPVERELARIASKSLGMLRGDLASIAGSLEAKHAPRRGS